MRTTLIGIILLSFLFLVRPVYSYTENNVLVRIVYDQSKSMFENPAANWRKAGADFFRNYFNQYSLRCQTVTVDYNPRDAMMQANNFVPDGYERIIVIFVTDVDFVGEKHSGLGALVSPTTQFYGVSLGSNASYGYMSRHLIPKHGQHFHANTVKEFNQTMHGILDEIGYDYCRAS
jgi:hypothetical protein